MNGVIHNTSKNRYYEAGQMVNHISVYQNSLIEEDFKALTEVTAVMYSRETFLIIIK